LVRKALLITTIVAFVYLNQFNMRSGICYADDQYQIKFATVAPEGSTWVKYMQQLDKRLNEKSNGRIKFRIYAGGIAGDEMDVLKKIRIGQIHCAAFSGVGIAQILPMARVLDLPFLFRNIKEVDIVREELSEFFSEQFRNSNFEFLTWVEVGDVYLFSQNPITKKDDLLGLKIWTWMEDPISKKTFQAMGTSPIPLSLTDVTTALNTNMIDTVYGPPLGAIAMQWHSYIRYMTTFPIAHSTGAVLISKDYFDKFPKDLSKLFKEEVQSVMAELTSELIRQANEAIEIIQKSGVTLTPMPAENEMKDFYKIHDLVALDLADDIYPKNLLDRVYKLLESIRNSP